METIEYVKTIDIEHISLDSLYQGSEESFEALDRNIEAIIGVEAPITLGVIKERFREIFGLAKISEKALNIILSSLEKHNYPVTDNLYDKVYWPEDGIYDIKYLRMGSRQIYDIPYQELSLLSREYMSKGIKGEALYRMILKFFDLEVLTEKARNYLMFVERKSI